jgi:hypothetical protein
MIGVMNKTEQAYAVELERRKLRGEIIDWAFEPETLRLAKLTTYQPDFRVITNDMHIEFHEVKACMSNGKILCKDDARVKFKIAAETHWMYGWVMVGRLAKGAGWKTELSFNCGDV